MEAWVLFVIMPILSGWAHPQIGNANTSLRPLADSNVIPRIRVEILSNSYDCPVYRVVNDSRIYGAVSWISSALAMPRSG